jgi:hypothetical protein
MRDGSLSFSGARSTFDVLSSSSALFGCGHRLALHLIVIRRVRPPRCSLVNRGSDGRGVVPEGLLDFAAKRLHRTSQGFSPGLCAARNPPCLSAVVLERWDEGGRRKSGGRGAPLGCSRVIHHRTKHRVPLSGHILLPPDPGLKPWAVLCSRFAAKSRHIRLGRAPIFIRVPAPKAFGLATFI